MEQRTDDWFAARLGKVTASRVADIMAKTKSGYSASRKNYMAELLCERLTGQKEDSFCSGAMQHGTDMEPQARMAYELDTGRSVQEVGFIDHPSIPMFGASPDGIMPDRGLEIKCPQTATHLDTLLSGKIAEKYIIQIHVGMLCTGLDKWDFVSYDDRLPPHLQLFIKTIELDKELASQILAEVTLFLTELDDMVKQLNARGK
jgi:putative phage-type endonuclease